MTRKGKRKKKPEGPFIYKVRLKPVKYAVDLLVSMVDEAKIEPTEEGWRIAVVDPAHVAMMEVLIPKHVFQHYDVWDDAWPDIVLDFVNIQKDLCCWTDDDIENRWVQFLVFPADHKVEMKIDCVTSIYKMEKGMLSDPKIPNLKLPCQFKMGSRQLVRILKIFDNHSDHLRIKYHIDEGKPCIKWTASVEGVVKAKAITHNLVQDPCDTMLSLNYLWSFAKNIDKWDDGVELTVDLGTDYPIRITKPSNSRCSVGILYILAPRIESDGLPKGKR